MFLNINKTKNKFSSWLLYLVAVFFIVGIVFIFSYLIFEKFYENKIYPGINLGSINLGGKTTEEAKKLLNQKINRINQDGIEFKYDNPILQSASSTKQSTTIMPTISSFTDDLAYQIIFFNVDRTIKQAFAIGRNNNFLLNLGDKLQALVFKKPINIIFNINEKEIEEILKNNYEKFEIPAKNAGLTTTQDTGGEIIFKINGEKIGKVIDYKKGLEELKTSLEKLNTTPIKLYGKTKYPTIYKNELLNIKPKARHALSLAPLTLKYEKKEWMIDKNKMAKWLTLERNQSNEIIINLDSVVMANFLEEEISSQIDKEPIDARFAMKNGRVIEFQGNQDGLKLDMTNSIIKIRSQFINQDLSQAIELIVKEIKSINITEETNDLGIKEIIGIGYSNFAGSPSNRRHNIKAGASTLNGLLIKPGEEFSLNKALGEINASSGYLQELVIKGGKTIPEYGGGLCQIGTTMFRVALTTGLPITARRNHSYRVSYYEPAGTDATIYDPWPDFRFVNDTANHILIQTRIEGDNLYFDFWGTKDDRIVEKTDSVIYNIVKPGPTKIIETLDLPIGEKKCTEQAHNGADAYFDYKITYPELNLSNLSTSTIKLIKKAWDKEKIIQTDSIKQMVKEKRFSSHYVPWREVCLIGVEKLSEEEEDTADETGEENNNTDTPENN